MPLTRKAEKILCLFATPKIHVNKTQKSSKGLNIFRN
jgi:hypothetical protein